MNVIGKSFWDIAAPVLGTIGGSLIGNPELGFLPSLGSAAGGAIGAGIGAGVNTGVETGRPLAGLLSGIGTGAGSYAGSQLLGPALGGIGGGTDAVSGGQTAGFLGQPVAKSLSDTALSGAANSVFDGSTGGDILGGAVGSAVGSNVAQSAAPSMFMPSVSTDDATHAQDPRQQSPMQLPGSLSSYGNLNPQQQSTNLATHGVYGGGNGPQEQNYFLNLINRQLVDPSGNVAANTNSLAPVDMSYLNQLGISGSTPTDYLKGISKFGT